MSEKRPILAGLKTQPKMQIHKVRELTEEEVNRSDEFMAVAAEARNRFRLFQILHLNYESWHSFTKSLLRPEDLGADETIELDRLMLNFLTSARALIDHFRQYYVRTYRNTVQETALAGLLNKLT